MKNQFGNRLKYARKMSGLSLQDLANAINNEITKQALSKYENGLMNPSSKVVLALSKVLNVKPDYFLKKQSIEFGELQFRKQVRFPKKSEESLIERMRDYVERLLEVEEIIGVNEEFINPLKDMVISKRSDVKQAASELRASWDLGLGSVHNLVEILENKGVKVFLSDEEETFDGLAVMTSKGIPIVAVNTFERPVERVRFTVIHELAHLLLNFNDEIKQDKKAIESFCHFFSSCFLLPENILINAIGKSRTYIKIDELISIKESYGVSIRAIVYRLEQIGVISKTYHKRWIMYMNKQYGRKKEPGNYKGEEKSKRIYLLVNRALAEDLITASKAASLLNTDINRIRIGYGRT